MHRIGIHHAVGRSQTPVRHYASAAGTRRTRLARALSSGKTQTIGVIVPAIDNPTFARGIDSLQRYLSSHAYLLLLATSGYDPEVEFKQAQNMVSRGIDGLILIGDVHSDAMRRLLASKRIPSINASIYHPHKPDASVGSITRMPAIGLAVT